MQLTKNSRSQEETDQEEVAMILNEIRGKKDKLPDKEKDILNWDANELKSYIFAETKGMSVRKKFKFAAQLDKRIKEAKRRKRYAEKMEN